MHRRMPLSEGELDRILFLHNISGWCLGVFLGLLVEEQQGVVILKRRAQMGIDSWQSQWVFVLVCSLLVSSLLVYIRPLQAHLGSR